MTNAPTTILPFFMLLRFAVFAIFLRNYDRDTHVGAMGWTSVYLLPFSIGVDWS